VESRYRASRSFSSEDAEEYAGEEAEFAPEARGVERGVGPEAAEVEEGVEEEEEEEEEERGVGVDTERLRPFGALSCKCCTADTGCWVSAFSGVFLADLGASTLNLCALSIFATAKFFFSAAFDSRLRSCWIAEKCKDFPAKFAGFFSRKKIPTTTHQTIFFPSNPLNDLFQFYIFLIILDLRSGFVQFDMNLNSCKLRETSEVVGADCPINLERRDARCFPCFREVPLDNCYPSLGPKAFKNRQKLHKTNFPGICSCTYRTKFVN
jgi:hypothetical protein